jgi:uncharacterized membrane protein YfhO
MLDLFSENDLKMTVKTSQASILLVNDLYYPDWHATIDGRDTKIFRGFTSLRAVAVPAGLHHIEMRYDSATFDLGWKITLATIALALSALLIGQKTRKTSKPRSFS